MIFVEAASGEDHVHLLADAFVTEARRHDMQISRYEIRSRLSYLRFIDGSRNEGQSDKLGEIARRHAGARLFVLGSGERLFDQFGQLQTGIDGAKPVGQGQHMFGNFDEPCLLSTTPPWAVGRREAELQDAGVTVLPLTEEGVVHAAALMVASDDERAEMSFPQVPLDRHSLLDWVARARLEMLSDIPISDSQTERLLDLLEDYFQPSGDWPIFLGLLLFPTITRAVTISFLHALEVQNRHVRVLPDGYSRMATLTRFARLPWFQAARAPDWLILAAIERSSPAEVEYLRRTLQHLFETEDVLPKREPGTTTPHPGLAADDWILRMFETGPDGQLDPMQRESLLVRVMRGDEVSDLAQPIGTARLTPPMSRIVTAIFTGSCAVIAVNTTLPDLIRRASTDILSTLGDVRPSDMLLGVVSADFLVGAALLIYPLIIWHDGFCPQEHRRLGWLSRLVRPSTALLTTTDGPSRWIDHFYRTRPYALPAEYFERTSDKFEVQALQHDTSHIQAQALREFWRRVSRITQVLGWVIEAGCLIAMAILLSSLGRDGTLSTSDGHLYLFLIFASVLGVRIYRWTGGWHAPLPQAHARLVDVEDGDGLVLRKDSSNPLQLGFVVLPIVLISYIADRFNADGNEESYLIPFWLMLCGIAAALLSMLRTKAEMPKDVWPTLSRLLGDFAVAMPMTCALAPLFVYEPKELGGLWAMLLVIAFVGWSHSMAARILSVAIVGLITLEFFTGTFISNYVTDLYVLSPELFLGGLTAVALYLSFLAWFYQLRRRIWPSSPFRYRAILSGLSQDLHDIAASPWFWAWLAILIPWVLLHLGYPGHELLVTGFSAALFPLIWKDRATLPALVLIGFSVLGVLPNSGWSTAINLAALLAGIMLFRFGRAPTPSLRGLARARVTYTDLVVLGGLVLMEISFSFTGVSIWYAFSKTLTYGFLIIAILALRRQFGVLAVCILLSFVGAIGNLDSYGLGIPVTFKAITGLFPFVAAVSLSVLLIRANRNAAFAGMVALLAVTFFLEYFGFGVSNPVRDMEPILTVSQRFSQSFGAGATIPAGWSRSIFPGALLSMLLIWPAILAVVIIKHNVKWGALVAFVTVFPLAICYSLPEFTLGLSSRDSNNLSSLATWFVTFYTLLAFTYVIPARLLRHFASIAWVIPFAMAILAAALVFPGTVIPTDLFLLEDPVMPAKRIQQLQVDALWTMPVFAITLIVLAAVLEIREHPLLIPPKWYLSRSIIWSQHSGAFRAMSSRFLELQNWLEKMPKSEEVSLVDAIWGPNARRIILGVLTFFFAYFCYSLWGLATSQANPPSSPL